MGHVNLYANKYKQARYQQFRIPAARYLRVHMRKCFFLICSWQTCFDDQL